MQGDWLSRRVTLLEQQVGRLDSLPSEVTALRQDMNTQFAAVRADMDAGFASVRADMDVRFDAVHQVLISLQTQLSAQQAQIAANHNQMLVLHEDVIARIATLGERWDQSRPRPRKKR